MYDDISDMHSTAFAGLNMDLFLDNRAPSLSSTNHFVNFGRHLKYRHPKIKEHLPREIKSRGLQKKTTPSSYYRFSPFACCVSQRW